MLTHAEIKLDNVNLYYSLSNSDLKVNWLTMQAYSKNPFHALKDINLHFKVGDKVGIIGLNGAGKSSLLRVLSGSVLPDQGSVQLKGKIFPLLTLSSDLLPYATCYQNIKLRGLNLGMRGKELEEYIDHVRQLADIEKFLHSPLKILSSGMNTRLSIAMFGYARPDILIMDEWVGTTDQKFLKKSSGNLAGLLDSVQILVLASHNRKIIREMCNKVIFMHKGEVKFFGSVEEGLALLDKEI